MSKRKKTDNEINLDDFFFGDKQKKEDVVKSDITSPTAIKDGGEVADIEKDQQVQKKPSNKKVQNITPYLVKNDITLKHIHVGEKTKKKLMRSAEILGVNQYDLATNILNIFFNKYGETIKSMEEDIL